MEERGRKQSLHDAYVRGTLSMAESDRPENLIVAGLRMMGSIEERGEGNGIVFGIMKRLTLFTAKSRFWTDDQIEEAVEEGRKIERLAQSSEDDNNQENG